MRFRTRLGWAAAAAAIALLAGAAPAGAARPKLVAAGIPEPANLAFDGAGRLWVASGGHLPQASNGVWLVRRGGRRPVQVVRGLYSALGLAWHGRRLYVAHIVPAPGGAGHVGRVTAFAGLRGGRFGRARVVVDGLPVGRHRLGSLVPGPRGRLYLGIGSRYDNQGSSERLSATVVSFDPDGGRLRVEATGLRNPYGLAFIPGTTRLLISEHGRDDLGLRLPPEELNLVDVSAPAPDFGFPECYGQGGGACAGTRSALVRLAAHAAPGAVAVAAGARGRATAFVPQFGSSFDAQPTGGDIVAVSLMRRGGRWRATGTRRFAGGFGRQNPLGAAIGPDGDLYVSLWTRARVVRFDLPRAPARPARAAPVSGLLSRLLGWVLERLLAWR